MRQEARSKTFEILPDFELTEEIRESRGDVQG